MGTDRVPQRLPDVAAFSDAWDRFLLALRRSQARGARTEPGLTLVRYHLLRPLLDGPLPAGVLAERAGIAPATATRIVDGLERLGVVRRIRSRTDRRGVRVSLTAAGREELDRKHAELELRRQRVYERLAPAERAQSERLLRHLAEILCEL